MDTLGNWYGKVSGNIVKIDVSGPTLTQTYNYDSFPNENLCIIPD